MEWQDIKTAKKNNTPLLLCVWPDMSDRLGRPDLEQWNGVRMVCRHIGVSDDGFDVGWTMAAPVGHGGFPDEWFCGWHPLPEPSA